MRKVYYFLSVLAAALFLASCQEKPLDPVSVITVDSKTQNDFDKWLEANYVNPYNIRVKYRYEMDESDYSYYTIPADLDCSITMAHLIKYLCIDSYDEVAGVLFTQHYFPKMFTFIGEWEYNNAGTIRLGTAEGGKKINLTGINYLPKVMAAIHHEFTHILNQTKDYPTEFKTLTPNDYVQDAWNDALYRGKNLPLGFISNYARKEDREDFAELLSMYVTNTPAQWAAWMEAASVDEEGNPASGADIITSKMEIVKRYMMDTFGIDVDRLREVVIRRQDEVAAGLVDLTSLEIN